MTKQLFRLTGKDFYLPINVELDGKVMPLESANIPFFIGYGGIPCFEANAYMLDLFRRGLNRRHRGGSLREYALNISPLIRFCALNSIDFQDLSDSHFSLFVRTLTAEKKNGRPKKKANSVLRVGRRCIDFLLFVSRLFHKPNMIGEHGRIRIVKKQVNIGDGKRRYVSVYWDHQSFPTRSAFGKRHPIGFGTVTKLKEAVRANHNVGIRQRQLCCISAFEQTGGRRGEVGNLSVLDVENALKTSDEAPMLKLTTLKKKQDTTRMIPVARIVLEQLANYARTFRRQIIRKTIGEKNDHGILFISHSSGMPLTLDTLTNEINLICKKAGITEPAHWHLFRHRYISERLKGMILRHKIRDKDGFKKSWLELADFKLELQQWTGHSDLATLDIYISLAFDEISSMKSLKDFVLCEAATDAALGQLDDFLSVNSHGHADLDRRIDDLTRIATALKSDLQLANRHNG
jgi:integrase